MEIVVQIVKQLPPVWPRVAVLAALALLFFLPEMRRILTHGGTGKRKLDRAKQLLEVRKLQLDVAALKATNPDAEKSILDAQIENILNKPVEDEEGEPLGWFERAKFSLAGAFSLMLIGTLALGFSGKFSSGTGLFKVTLMELLVAVPCALIASALPSRSRWACVFHGFLILALLGALTVVARG